MDKIYLINIQTFLNKSHKRFVGIKIFSRVAIGFVGRENFSVFLERASCVTQIYGLEESALSAECVFCGLLGAGVVGTGSLCIPGNVKLMTHITRINL